MEGNELYGRFAELYSVIADDREFDREIVEMCRCANAPMRTFVELFAGPAYHSRTIARSMPDVDVIAVDSSQHMESEARRLGFQGIYKVGDALHALGELSDVSLVCIPRFSTALVNEKYLRRLLHQIRDSLSTGGLLFLEVHPDSVQEGNWELLEIHERHVQLPNGRARCRWPASVESAGEPNAVDMKIEVTLDPDDGDGETLEFTSREYLHPRDSLLNWAQEAGLAPVVSRGFETPSGRFLAFVAEPRRNRTAESLVDATLCSHFDVSTDLGRQLALSRSGLDTAQHDVPLSLHIYNLL